ncbi:hypothetical protein [Agrococcus sp. SCSIO52902]|uniref:hypothetical protein n=1 Tax=Agrococcus sp. SCSIO52902 TaxID=2933290 RepID=UPI001FF29B48|nr:hypothetical protein [Agrococcus sp. SCSIO52902]UOV99867.1 hypothetical protein MU522_07860 [Agrococcus sp. SCSIO52902]
MTRLRTRTYFAAAGILLAVSLVVAVVLAPVMGALASLLVLSASVSLQMMLAAWFIASRVSDRSEAVKGEIEKARSRLDWRIVHEDQVVYNSLKRLHEERGSELQRLLDGVQGTRRQGDRSVKALRAQSEELLHQRERLAGVQALVVELVARADGDAHAADDDAEPRRPAAGSADERP